MSKPGPVPKPSALKRLEGTPAARSRVTVPAAEAEDDPLDNIIRMT